MALDAIRLHILLDDDTSEGCRGLKMPFVRYTDGPAVHADKPRRQRLTSAQILARRHALWLHAAEVGLPDPVTRRNRPHTADEIASLWSVDRSTIFRGIESARRLQAMGVRDE